MKVKLAVQILSSSVADSNDYCREKLKLSQFTNSEATTKFIRICDRLFDIFNSNNIFGKNFKAPLSLKNEQFWRPFLDEAFHYIKNLKLSNGTYIVKAQRKTGFLGMLTLIATTNNVFECTIKCKDPLLE
ncbi:hypothetical protein Zmor_006124 [Zophobas morio]|uniref:Transposable element P transposase-like GTP-binding insertion domain-containing protein n=1 Tax=Zophobas morio TaxID=2755281 RepID=A0AA38IWX3_9CUCU|nr:hypothetical protein Zmor_006124 [Zophobas morio]